jgi:glucose/mannose-6-phosphate isomerase
MTKNQQNYIKSMELLGEQIGQSYNEAKTVKLLDNYRRVNKIVTCGMGGSQLGVDLVKQLFGDKIKLPITQVRGYNLPGFVDDKTLIFLISYSGSTEEVLKINSKIQETRYKQITNPKNQKLKPFIISSGGVLAQLAQTKNIPAYLFNPINNPSGQPRTGIGYTIGSLLAVFSKLGLIEVDNRVINWLVKSYNQKYLKIKKSKLLVGLSKKIKNKIPVIVASEFLQGNAHVMSNQINESAKQWAVYYGLPELNHHLMEGLTFPKTNRQNLHFLFFFSKNYHLRNQKRYRITQAVLKKQGINYSQIDLTGDKYGQSMEMLTLGIQLSYKLSQINKVDPNKVPWVDYFKKGLKD